jgi:proteasome accessory factor B
VNRTERLLDLIALLVNARRPVPFEEIRVAFPEDYGEGTLEAARRKFERDKRELLELGIPLEYVPPDTDDLDAGEDEGGYVVDRRRAFLAPLSLDADDMALLYLVGLSTASDPSFPYRDDMLSALRKIELSSTGAGRSTSAAPRVHIDRTPLDAATLEAVRGHVAVLEDAVRRKKRLALNYHPPAGEPSRHQVDPYGLFWRAGRWSLVGFSQERGAVRVFPVHRLSDVQINAVKPATPDFEPPDGFRLGDHIRVPAWQEELEPPLTVELDVAADYAWLAEREFATRASGDGAWRRLHLVTTNAAAVLGWALGMGPHARVIEPPELRATAIAALKRLA